MSHHKQPRTPAGMRLRALREACGKTQLDVELDANLGIGYLQRLERGKVQQPERDTLDRILAVLDAAFQERQEILESFGYAITIAMPNQIEIQWAVNNFQAEVQQAAFPMYLLDCGHRLLAWNALVPNLFSELKTAAQGTLMPRLIFDPMKGIAASVLNPDTFFSAQVRILQYEKQRCSSEVWYSGFLDEMSQYETFNKYWYRVDTVSRAQVPMRPLTPLKLDVGQGLIQFRLIAETFGQDPRFRVVYYLPDDLATFRQGLQWQG